MFKSKFMYTERAYKYWRVETIIKTGAKSHLYLNYLRQYGFFIQNKSVPSVQAADRKRARQREPASPAAGHSGGGGASGWESPAASTAGRLASDVF